MKKTVLISFLILLYFNLFCQNEKRNKDFNLGFEKINKGDKLPEHWTKWGADDYSLLIDTVEKHGGKASLLIEHSGSKSEKSIGSCVYKIPADYLGNEIELRGYLKLQNVLNGSAGLLLRIDDKAGKILEFENGHQKGLQGTTSEWNYYSVSIPIPTQAKNIYIGAWLSGSGKLWMDDFEVLINGKDISEAKQRVKIELKADRDNEFDKGSKISSIQLTPEKIEYLTLLGKVWGFLKYYHPAIAKGNFNWDYELFRILPKITSCKNEIEINAVLSSWIANMGEFKHSDVKKIDSSKVKFLPDLQWINDTVQLGPQLAAQLRQIKDAERTNENYYIELTAEAGNPKFENEKVYSQLSYPDAGFQILSLYRYWNMIQYFYPYKNLFDENWNSVLKEFIPKFTSASNELEYKLTVLSLIGRIHDTHANILAPEAALSAFKGINNSSAEISFIENKAVVTGTIEMGLDQRQELSAGDIILKINNRNTDDVVQQKLEYSPASNYPAQLRNMASDLLRTNDTVLNITFQRGDSIKTARVKCYSRSKIYNSKAALKKDTCFRYLAPDIAYIYTGSIKNRYLEKMMPDLMKSKGMVIDLRCYPSEFIVFTLSSYLLPKSIRFAAFTNGNIITPGLFTFTGNDLKIGERNRKYYKGKVVIIVNETTQSQAEYTAMALLTAPNVTIIGSTTVGADGNVSAINLPGGIKTQISGIGVYYPDGRETQRIGIVPDIEVHPTIKGISEHRDELLERAVYIINSAKGH